MNDLTTLPLFPLPVVHFPGTPQLLHIFEPRYRQLLEDCLASDKRFGLSYLAEDSESKGVPRPGDVGCRTTIQSRYVLPNGQSNILTVGDTRYVVHRLAAVDRPYHVGVVEYFDDGEEEAEPINEIAQEVRHVFRDLQASLPHQWGGDQTPALPDDPKMLSFFVAGAIELDLDAKEKLLRLTSARRRLAEIHKPLVEARDRMERISQLQERSRGNGHHDHEPDIVTPK